jgi:hypothetical protein
MAIQETTALPPFFSVKKLPPNRCDLRRDQKLGQNLFSGFSYDRWTPVMTKSPLGQ